MIRTFFRIVESDPPTTDDFLSLEQRGIPTDRTLSAEERYMRTGISVFATLTQAEVKARTFPHLGQFIAIMEIDDEGPFALARTGKGRGHHTLWGESVDLMNCVVRIVRVRI